MSIQSHALRLRPAIGVEWVMGYKKWSCVIRGVLSQVFFCTNSFLFTAQDQALDRFSRRALTGAKTTVGLWTLLHNGHHWLRKKTQNEIKKKATRRHTDL